MNKITSSKILFGFILCMLGFNTMAAMPLWTMSPTTPTTLSVSSIGTANVEYLVKNNSNKSKRLVIQAMPGVEQDSICQLAPAGQAGSRCTLGLTIRGSELPAADIKGGPKLCLANADGSPNPNQCYQPAANDVLNLSVVEANVAINAAPSNLSFEATTGGTIMITNTAQSTGAATNIQAIPAMGSAIMVTSNNCPTSLNVGASCTIDINSPTPEGPTAVNITGDNTNSVTVNVTVTTPLTTTLSISRAETNVVTQGILTEEKGISETTCIENDRNWNTDGAEPFCESIARIFSITNTGENTAFNVNYAITPALPAGTTATPATCGNIAPGDTCTITITPGNNPSQPTPGEEVTPSVLTFMGTSTTNSVSTNVRVLTYTNQFEGGYIFSFDDFQPPIADLVGKVMALTDENSELQWSADLYETNGQNVLSGSQNIEPILEATLNAGSTAPALQSCLDKTSEGFSNWILPAICEMGYDDFSFGNGCGSSASPTIQNMVSSFGDTGFMGGIDFGGTYWSSSEVSEEFEDPEVFAWFQIFDGSQQLFIEASKQQPFSVRCIRQFGSFG